jgi:hypothetical protein
MAHLVDHAVDDIARIIGDRDIAFTRQVLAFFVPAQAVPGQDGDTMFAGVRNTRQQALAGQVGAEGEIADFHVRDNRGDFAPLYRSPHYDKSDLSILLKVDGSFSRKRGRSRRCKIPARTHRA